MSLLGSAKSLKFCHERALWVTFGESKVTENALRRVRNLLRLVVVFPG